MAATGGAIEFNFKGNLTQLRRDLNEASRLASAHATDVTRATSGPAGGFAGMFSRTPELNQKMEQYWS